MEIPNWKSQPSAGIKEVLASNIRWLLDRRLIAVTEKNIIFSSENVDGSSTVEKQDGNSKHNPDSGHIFGVILRQLGGWEGYDVGGGKARGGGAVGGH